MSKPTKSLKLLDKSVSAVISAIEVYNKPDFKYREETFCLLMTNAWELLLKAKFVKEKNNHINSIYVKEPVLRKDGTRGTRKVYKKNRCGNNFTLDLFKILHILKSELMVNIDDACEANIELLAEIRDNATHFYNPDPEFSKKVLEVGTASLKSYVTYVQLWFDYDLSRYNFYLMPISFFNINDLNLCSKSRRDIQIQRLLDYIENEEKKYASTETTHNITLRLETKVVKSKAIDAIEVRYTNNPNAPAIRVQEEDIIVSKYPLDYKKLSATLRSRYSDFKITKKYHDIRKSLESNKKYCKERLLDPNNKNSSSKKFYSSEIIKEFDKHYSRINSG